MKSATCNWLAVILLIAWVVPAARADFDLSFSNAVAVLAPGTGTTTTSFDVTFRNTMPETVDLDGYSLLIDIDPPSDVAPSLPTGVSFSASPVQYLLSAADDTDPNPTPAAGDLGVGQFFVLNTTLAPGESIAVVTVSLTIDRAVASVGDYAIGLNLTNENTVDYSLNGVRMSANPTVTPGTLSLVAVPEPTGFLYGAFIVALTRVRIRHRSASR